jgi:hypothetical protein
MNKILNRVKNKEAAVSTYVLSSQIVQVLSCIFAFEGMYENYQVKKKDFKKVLSSLESENITGIVHLTMRDSSRFILMEKGKIVTDSFAQEYGQIVCGLDAVNKLLDQVLNEGATINVFAAKSDEIEEKKRIVQEEAEMEKQLIVRPEGGMFKADTVKVDEHLVREWGFKPGSTFDVEIETPDGRSFSMKCQAGRRVGGYINLPVAIMKKLKVRDGDLVNVRPAK